MYALIAHRHVATLSTRSAPDPGSPGGHARVREGAAPARPGGLALAREYQSTAMKVALPEVNCRLGSICHNLENSYKPALRHIIVKFIYY